MCQTESIIKNNDNNDNDNKHDNNDNSDDNNDLDDNDDDNGDNNDNNDNNHNNDNNLDSKKNGLLGRPGRRIGKGTHNYAEAMAMSQAVKEMLHTILHFTSAVTSARYGAC